MSLNKFLELLKKSDFKKPHANYFVDRSKKILIISASLNDFIIHCCIAIMLKKKGHKVTILIENIHKKKNKYKNNQIKQILYYVRNMSITIEENNKKKVSKSLISKKINNKILRQSEEDLQRISKNPILNLNKFNQKKEFKAITKSNTQFAIRFNSFIRKNKFDTHIIDSGSWAQYGIAFSILREMNKTVTCYGYRNDTKTILISNNSPFNQLDVERAWKTSKRNINISKTKNIEKLTKEVSKKEFYTKDVFLNFHTKNPLEKSKIYKELSLNKKDYIILILTNLAFDTTVLTKKTNYLFDSHFDWLHKTLDYLRVKKNCYIILRPHPAEKLTNCKMTCQKYISKNIKGLESNFIILPSNTSINTYGLIEVADLGLVYSSDIGWEMIIKNKPVISVGKGAAWGKNIQFEPNSLDEYFRKIDFFIKRKNYCISKKKINNGKKFFKFYIEEIPKEFPFPLFDHWTEKTFKNVYSLFNGASNKRYNKTFELLSNSNFQKRGLIGKIN